MSYGYYIYSKSENIDFDRSQVLNDTGKKDEFEDHIINIALFGTDTVDGTKGLSDANLIFTINTRTKAIKLCSIMRDTYVEIPGHGQNIINMAMMDGGPALALKTINTNFNLDLDKFISVNLNALPKIIDRLGGLDFSIDQSEVNNLQSPLKELNLRNNTNVDSVTKIGMQHFNGTQATAYCRIRHTQGNDFKRTERQRLVFSLIYNKLKALSYSECISFVNDMIPLVSTNLSYREILSIGKEIINIGSTEIAQNRFPNDGDHWSTGTFADYRLNINKEATAKKMNDFIYN